MEKKLPSTALAEFLPPDKTGDRKGGKKRGSVFQCAEVRRNTALQCADSSRVTVSHTHSSSLRENELSGFQYLCWLLYVSIVSHQTC